MFCDEKIISVYVGVIEDALYTQNAFLDCYHDLAYHCTEGYRMILETENYIISIAANGVIKESKDALCKKKGECLQNGVELIEKDEPPFVSLETMLFVGERLLSVVKEKEIFLLQFEDFTLKLIPHSDGADIEGLRKQNHFSYNYVLGCNRHLKRKCPHCDAGGEILLDFVDDYIVRCKNCKKSTGASMNLVDAIADWNAGKLNCIVDDIQIE